jgi:hypothetical protein
MIDGRIAHVLLLEIFTNRGIGTMVTREHVESIHAVSDGPEVDA